MSNYSVFVASSIVDYALQRAKIVYLFQRLSHATNKLDVDVFICEQASKAIAARRKQEEYNDAIRKSDMFLLLAGTSIGEYTLEELRVAVESARGTGRPWIVMACETRDLIDRLQSVLGQFSATQYVLQLSDTNELLRRLLRLIALHFDINLTESIDGEMYVCGRRIVSKR